jgi:hypothetical protein
MDAASGAGGDTGGFLSSIDPVITEVALLRYASLCIELHHSEWTSLQARFAPSTGLGIDEDDPVGSLRNRIDRTHLLTGGIRALEAPGRMIDQPQSAIDFLNPFRSDLDPSGTLRRAILLFARNLTRIAPPADLFIYDQYNSLRHCLLLG